MDSSESLERKKAMNIEIQSLADNKTWVLTEIPKGSKALPCKWVYNIKTNPDGSIEKFKARLVIKVFNTRPREDIKQTFSPVARMATIRSIQSIAASENMYLSQFDVSTVFLYGFLEETIFMK